MKCFKCKGIMREGLTTFVSDEDGICIVIRHVPCLLCDECGEVAYTGNVMERLQAIVKAVRAVMTSVAVVEYTEAA